jgi:hypothetical protein
MTAEAQPSRQALLHYEGLRCVIFVGDCSIEEGISNTLLTQTLDSHLSDDTSIAEFIKCQSFLRCCRHQRVS